MNPLLAAWLRDPVERGVYQLMRAYMTRDRDVRMRLYPSLATIVVFAALPLIDRDMTRGGPLFALMFIGMLTNTAMATLKMSPQYAAADVFRYAPLSSSAPIFHGARKAVIVGFVLPAFALIVPILWFTVGQHQLLLPILPVLAAMPTLSLVNGLVGDYVPLSMPNTIGRQGVNNILFMTLGAIAAAAISALGAISVRRGWFWGFFAIELVVLAIAHAVLLRGIRVRRFEAAAA
jgi:MFS family permease